MTSTIAAEVSPDWTGLAFDYDFEFGAPNNRQAESIAPVVNWSGKSVPKNASARCRCGANSAVYLKLS